MVRNIYDEIENGVSKSNLSVIGIETQTQSQIIMHDILYKFQIIDLGEIDLDSQPSILSEIRESKINQIFNDFDKNTPNKKIIVFYLKNQKIKDNLLHINRIKNIHQKLKEESLKYNIPILIFVNTYQSLDGVKLFGGTSHIFAADFCMIIDNKSEGGFNIIKNRYI
jgi:archaellum biogenesis ATPase FlaH